MALAIQGDREKLLHVRYTLPKWLISLFLSFSVPFSQTQTNISDHQSGEKELSQSPFSVSAPASNAEFRSVYIDSRGSGSSEWTCWNGSKWKVFDKNDAGFALYPIHDACLEITHRIAHQHLLYNPHSGSRSPEYTSVEAYYGALLRLHERNTQYPYDTEIEDEVAKFTPYPGEYGAYKLEWEHQYYGAARFADGSSWSFEPGWEVCNLRAMIPKDKH